MGGKTHEICLILHEIADIIYMDMMHVSAYEKMNAFTELGQSKTGNNPSMITR